MSMDPGNPPTGFRGLFEWLQRFYDAWKSGRDIRAPGVRIRQTSRGVSRTAAGGEDGSTNGLQFKGQWVDGSYAENDIVICETNDEEDDGHEAGTFIATTDIVAGDMHPGVEPQTALAHGVLSGGGLAAAAVDDGGAGYSSAPGVAVTGDGSGATAHATIDANGSVNAIVVDSAGTGYTTITLTLDGPDQTQKWEDFANGHQSKRTYRPATQARNKQRIVINAGRDSLELPYITLFKKLSDGTVGSVSIDINDIPSGAGNKVLKIRQWQVCVDGEYKNVLLLSSDAYS